MIVGAGGNITVQTGDDGVLVVDTGSGGATDRESADDSSCHFDETRSLHSQHELSPGPHRRQRTAARRTGAGRPRRRRAWRWQRHSDRCSRNCSRSDERAHRKGRSDARECMADGDLFQGVSRHLLQRRRHPDDPHSGCHHRRRQHRLLPPLRCHRRRRYLPDHHLSGNRREDRRHHQRRPCRSEQDSWISAFRRKNRKAERW